MQRFRLQKFCEFLRKHAIKIIKKDKNKIIIKKAAKNHMEMQKCIIFVKKNCENKYLKDKKI